MWALLSSHQSSFVSSFEGFRKCVIKSIGSGKMIVEFFSADIELSVCNGKSKIKREN